MKITLGGLAGFVALACATAVVAQTVEGVDVGAIRAKAKDETADAQVFLDGVVNRGEEFREEAEAVSQAGHAAMAAIDPKDLPRGPEGPVDFDELIDGAVGNTKVPFGEGPLFVVFASLSMPEDSLRALIRDTTKAGGVVAFRGFPGNNAKAFVEGMKKVVTAEDQEAHLAIDPRLFRAFSVTAAPTFVVVSRDYELCEGFSCSSALPPFDKMVGNVTVEYALESFAGGNSGGAGVASVALANLKRSR
ncbi:MAG: type-F conjugative transfer system pilin assembly protein TrbC [Sphingomonadaceae bacterium]|nr:type-F conjugative transfer system pilin assembly protein TrbC [Sphingomonadaceae bacterium]